MRLSGPQVPSSACGSGQGVTFASTPATPVGSVTFSALIASSPSGRVIVTENGEKAPACVVPPGFGGPACRLGVSGSGGAQEAPPGPVLISKLVDGLADATPSAHGVNSEVVAYVPHLPGVLTEARPSSKKCSLRSSKGSWGVFANVDVSWPVIGSGVTLPASLTRIPSFSSLISR